MIVNFLDASRAGLRPRHRCPSCNHPMGNYADMNHRGSRECDLLARRRAMYRGGWTRIKDIPRWQNGPPSEAGWLPKILIKSYARKHGGAHIFTQTPIKGVAKNYWVATWTLHVVYEQIEAFANGHEGPFSASEAEDFAARTVGVLDLAHQSMPPVPEEWKRPDAVAEKWLETGQKWLMNTKALHKALWDQEWFRAWEPLPVWMDAPTSTHSRPGWEGGLFMGEQD